MKKRSMAIYIASGLIGLFIVSLFVEIQTQVIAGLSIATLIFTIAQMLDSWTNFWSEDLLNQVDAYNNVGIFNLSPENILLTKVILRYMNQSKRQKIMHILATVLYCISFAILFTSFVVKINISEKVGASVTILSSALLFLSIGIADKQQERKSQWDEAQMIVLMNKNIAIQAKSKNNMEENENGQTQNANSK